MQQRTSKLRQRIDQLKLDAFLISSLSNIRYLFGFTGSNAIAAITRDASFLITDRRYTNQANQEVAAAEVVIAEKDLLGELSKLQLGTRINLGFEAVHLSVKSFTQLKKIVPNARLMATEMVVERIASVKDTSEISHIRAAGEICRRVFEEVLQLIRPGVSELEISAELSYRTRLQGSERDPFEPIVASGVRSAYPHGVSSNKKVEAGELVIIDFGTVVNGYVADFTRTIVIGEPSAEQSKMAAAVRSALEVSENAAKPGLGAQALDQAARTHLQQKGYGDFFQHSLGHGIGLEVHALPRIGESSGDVLEQGNVITLEPGIYIPGKGGVRIEDDFVITEEAVENLTPFQRDLFCVA